jgi:hypothetical protein
MGAAGLAQQLLKCHLLRLVFALGQLFEHHLALHRKVAAIEAWLQHQIQQQIQRLRCCLGRDQHVIVHIIETGGGIAVAPQGLHLEVELTSLKLLASFEHHVLEEVRQPGFSLAFTGATGPAPEIKAHHRRLGQLDLHQAHAVFELVAPRVRQGRGRGTRRRGQRIECCV